MAFDIAVECYLNGMLPRSNLALQTGSSWLKGRETKENFEKLLEKETINMIELQQSMGFDYIIDGLLFWDDFLRPMADALGLHRGNSNANENPVTRQIYTNTFYRKPIILNRIADFDGKIVNTKFIKFINSIPNGKRKVILPSPFAAAYLSDGIHRNEKGSLNKNVFTEVLFDLAKILNYEIKRLEKNSGISFVQFNEPCIAYAEESKFFWEGIADSLSTAVKGVKAITSLHIYNGDASKFLPELADLPVDRIGVDAYATNMRNFIGAGFNKFLEVGIINSKNSLIENPQLLAHYARQIIERIKPNGLALVPNRPLELVPQEIAIKKIEALAKGADLVKNKYVK